MSEAGTLDPALLSFDGKTVGDFLAKLTDISSLSATDQALFLSYMGVAATGLASINAATGIVPPQSALMSAM